MSDVVDDLAEGEKRDRIRWGVLGLVVAVVVMGLVTLVLWYDDPPADDGWMMPQIVEIPEEQNGLAKFCRETEGKDLVGNMPEVRVVDAANADKVKAFLEANAEMRAKIDALLATNTVQWQWPVDWENLTMSVPLAGVENSLNYGKLLRLEGSLLVYEKRLDEALVIAGKLRELGKGWQHADATMIHWLVALTVRMFGTDLMIEVAKAPEADLILLGKIQQKLQPDWAEISGALAQTLRVEYYYSKQAEDPDGAITQIADEGWQRFAVRWLLKENRTTNLYLEWQRPFLTALEAADERSFLTVCNQFDNRMKQLDAESWKVVINANAGGYVLMNKTFPTFNQVYRRALHSLVRERLLKTMVAVRVFDLKHGEMPESLEAVLGEEGGLKAIPMDPFDGKPLKWHPIRRVMYSVWENGKDDDGMLGDAPAFLGPDIGLPYWWRELAVE